MRRRPTLTLMVRDLLRHRHSHRSRACSVSHGGLTGPERADVCVSRLLAVSLWDRVMIQGRLFGSNLSWCPGAERSDELVDQRRTVHCVLP
uniref:Secreted protein n=1 Tax=Knipowitschia caucasica TaxID=637954 RepID=A0AAV2KBB2_KNICA